LDIIPHEKQMLNEFYEKGEIKFLYRDDKNPYILLFKLPYKNNLSRLYMQFDLPTCFAHFVFFLKKKLIDGGTSTPCDIILCTLL